MMLDNTISFNKELEERKFRWINVGLIGIGTSLTLLIQIKKSWAFLIALGIFVILVIFEAIGLYTVEKNIAILGGNPWYVKLWFYNSTLVDIIIFIISIIFLGIGLYEGW